MCAHKNSSRNSQANKNIDIESMPTIVDFHKIKQLNFLAATKFNNTKQDLHDKCTYLSKGWGCGSPYHTHFES